MFEYITGDGVHIWWQRLEENDRCDYEGANIFGIVGPQARFHYDAFGLSWHDRVEIEELVLCEPLIWDEMFTVNSSKPQWMQETELEIFEHRFEARPKVKTMVVSASLSEEDYKAIEREAELMGARIEKQ